MWKEYRMTAAPALTQVKGNTNAPVAGVRVESAGFTRAGSSASILPLPSLLNYC
jgi:hypothetical protein